MNLLNEIEHQDVETGLQMRWLRQVRILSRMSYLRKGEVLGIS